jgi:hypothetical protein
MIHTTVRCHTIRYRIFLEYVKLIEYLSGLKDECAFQMTRRITPVH